jgi:hypothetical protein
MFIQVTTHADQKPKININNINAIIEKQVHFAGGLVLDLTEESIKEIELIIAPKGKQTKSDNVDSKLLDLFNKLHTLTKGKGKPVFSLQREKKLNDLLTKHRMTEEQLIKAATNIGNDKFLQGDNDSKKRYGDVDYLLRPDKAAKYADLDIKEEKKKMF